MKNKIILILIILFGFILRFWQLGVNPPSLDWDEASLGYNSYSILTTEKDEYGNNWPLSIRSFGDYKPPLYTYLTMMPIYLWGLNEFSTRFISALLGSLTVIVGYFLIKELFPKLFTIYYLLFTFFFAVSSWHIQFSRVAFEANTALFFIILGIWFFKKGIKSGKYFIASFGSFGLSLYAYHSPRVIVPLLLFGLTIIYLKDIKKKLGNYLFAAAFFIIIILPIVQQYSSSTGARFGAVSAINPNERLGSSIKEIEIDEQKGNLLGKLMHNRRIVYGREILAGYLDHFNFDFLFLTGDPPGRHHAAGMGMLYFWDLPFVLIGIVYLIRRFTKDTAAIFCWFLVAPVASSLATGTPHAVRAFFYLPVYQIFITFGVLNSFYFLNRLGLLKFVRRNIFFRLISGFFVLNFFYYLHMYYIHTPVEYAKWWQYGYKQVIREINRLDKDKNNTKIIVTYSYDQPYIYFLFYNKINPSWYQHNWGSGEVKRSERSFGRYEFRNITWDKDERLTHVILVGDANEIPQSASGIFKEIYFPDGSVAFRMVAR